MEITQKDLAAIRGDFFSSGYTFQPKFDSLDLQYFSRREFLTNLCKGKDVIHLGCVDHNIDMIDKKIRKGKWLHKDLYDVANRCLGIDLNEIGIRHIKENYEINDLLCMDVIENTANEILSKKWDYFLIPEVLEHQDNPVDFLSKIRQKYTDHTEKFIITVPNAFDLNLRNSLKNGKELINSDHRFWFSPYTLTKVLYQAGFRSITLRLCRNGTIKKRAIFKNYLLANRPFFRNNLIAITS